MKEEPKAPIPVAILSLGGDEETREGYELLASSYVSTLSLETQGISGVDPDAQRMFVAQVFNTSSEALDFLEHHKGIKGRKLVFLTAAYMRQARKLAVDLRDIQVVVFTASPPVPAEVVIIQKEWVTGEGLCRMLR